MSNKTRSVLKIIAIILAALAVLMYMGWVAIPFISVYKFWMMTAGFVLLLVSSK
jgi:hypothetical protein